MYKRPICNCGEPLFIYDEEIFKLYQPITKKGFPSKRIIRVYDGSTGVIERLYCLKCHMNFWIDEDSEGRIIREEELYI